MQWQYYRICGFERERAANVAKKDKKYTIIHNYLLKLSVFVKKRLNFRQK